ncbi:Protein of unknown function DUF1350 [Ostreococcus tauri]|uniref:Alpha/Beta hydrolase protein n=1 Tax=Ostreococcus tauri TaxID=70448 RepID=A0A090MD33_OSTTA|nr:Protein of unknown function DUF1350 [Ostreococcus tauri]CEF99959.1 Protein of unknown function DUF1350 [Ostreococcus tauri]|eukprot:XP_003082420.2 Protein of unknown function DUF1350 [Ostreococcus tauri]
MRARVDARARATGAVSRAPRARSSRREGGGRRADVGRTWTKASTSTSSAASTSEGARDAFGAFERWASDAAGAVDGSSAERGWRRVDEAYVLAPKGDAKATRVIHFCGGAFVGASPQVTYSEMCETLVREGNAIVIATPIAMGLDHLRVADEAWQRYERCARELRRNVDGFDELPVYGVGHSFGALLTVLIASRYETKRRGNVMMSFNNKPATDAIPLFADVLAPGLRGLSPILDAANKSPLRSLQRNADTQLREFAPPLVRELLPILDTLEPVILEIADGRAEFTPTPTESAKLIQKYYSTKKNLLIKFQDDTIDETSALAATLAGAVAASDLDLTVRARPGDHVFPLWRDTGIEIPTEIYDVAEQGGDILAAFGDAFGIRPDASPLGVLRESFDRARAQAREARDAPGSDENRARMRALVADVLVWMDTP